MRKQRRLDNTRARSSCARRDGNRRAVGGRSAEQRPVSIAQVLKVRFRQKRKVVFVQRCEIDSRHNQARWGRTTFRKTAVTLYCAARPHCSSVKPCVFLPAQSGVSIPSRLSPVRCETCHASIIHSRKINTAPECETGAAASPARRARLTSLPSLAARVSKRKNRDLSSPKW